jgi:alanyl-tRNA synthetase
MSGRPTSAAELRRAFVKFFVDHGHFAEKSASLVPQDPTVLFTIAGMVPFKPYLLGDEVAPHPRVTSVQKCLRAGGKHNDLDAVGTNSRSLTFFEMLGNWSFGDYFKEEAIPLAWELITEVLGVDGDRIWVTVHDDDDVSAAIWLDEVGFPAARLQRTGEENWWQMADVGPCGPDSELFFDKGAAYGSGGGPAHGAEERYVELWNLVFMLYDQKADGSLVELPRRNVDTGAGLERVLGVLEGVDSVFETDVLFPLVDKAQSLTGRRYGADPATDVSLRILADHARAMTFLVGDGVMPSNEGRGYVLRRIIRRAALRAFRLGLDRGVVAPLAETVATIMGDDYPDLRDDADLTQEILSREEDRFRQTLRSGFSMLEEELARGEGVVPGDVAFRLHDTYGFPIELTREVAEERGRSVDDAGFEAAMAEQRERGREAGRRTDAADERLAAYRDLVHRLGTTRFSGYETTEDIGTVLAVLPAEGPAESDGSRGDGAGAPAGGGEPAGRRAEVFLDRTPFYAEAGGQVGDTGELHTSSGRARVTDTTYALPGLIRHHVVIVEGDISPGEEATAVVDAERRDAIRRNHTGTHLLHWALREVLGPHVAQQGSLVAPDRLRFDFSHYSPLSEAETERVEDLVNAEVLRNQAVHTLETTKAAADARGAIAFFDEKYGEVVRVVEAGAHSVELCGGTHVGTLGMIGPLRIVSESSIGANTRRIFALTGSGSIEWMKAQERLLARAAELLRTAPGELPERIEGLRQRVLASEDELAAVWSRQLAEEAERLAEGGTDGMVVARRDGLSRERLRQLAIAVRDRPGQRAAVLIGIPDEGRGVALVAAVARGGDLVASELLREAAKVVGGGGGNDPEVAVAGGRDVARIDEALGVVRAKLGLVGR